MDTNSGFDKDIFVPDVNSNLIIQDNKKAKIFEQKLKPFHHQQIGDKDLDNIDIEE